MLRVLYDVVKVNAYGRKSVIGTLSARAILDSRENYSNYISNSMLFWVDSRHSVVAGS